MLKVLRHQTKDQSVLKAAEKKEHSSQTGEAKRFKPDCIRGGHQIVEWEPEIPQYYVLCQKMASHILLTIIVL